MFKTPAVRPTAGAFLFSDCSILNSPERARDVWWAMDPDDDLPSVRYRRLAQQCMAVLPIISLAPAREAVLEMAKTWLRLAQEEEKRSDQPVTQQQQHSSRPKSRRAMAHRPS
jgi:hypothetical protein